MFDNPRFCHHVNYVVNKWWFLFTIFIVMDVCIQYECGIMSPGSVRYPMGQAICTLHIF